METEEGDCGKVEIRVGALLCCSRAMDGSPRRQAHSHFHRPLKPVNLWISPSKKEGTRRPSFPKQATM